MADVFISYARGDRPRIQSLISALDVLEVSYFIDAKLAAGAVFDEALSSELQSAKAVIVCWSADAMASKWVRAEASYALERSVLIAAFLEKIALIPPFNLVHTVDLSSWNGDLDNVEFGALLTRVGALCDMPDLRELAQRLQSRVRGLEPAVLRMLGPLLARWLDKNLPDIVEQKVEAELARIAKLAKSE